MDAQAFNFHGFISQVVYAIRYEGWRIDRYGRGLMEGGGC